MTPKVRRGLGLLAVMPILVIVWLAALGIGNSVDWPIGHALLMLVAVAGMLGSVAALVGGLALIAHGLLRGDSA